jgi:steroid 5-alpha reductase family enzyme
VHRIHHVGKDKRFDEVKDKPATFLFFWMMQAMWVFVTLSPVLILNLSKTAPALSLLDAPGIALFALGITTEAIADQQKAQFREEPENKGRYINEGLWNVSRHPNYAGEVCLWLGIFLTSASSFTKASHWGSIASPLFVFGLVRFLSGVPILEKTADEKWGKEEGYQKYKEEVPVFWPTLGSIQRALNGTKKE